MPPQSRIDILIIGAGPAGVMCANALAMAGVSVRIIDKRPVKVAAGHGDGIQPRTIEVLQSYGLAERLVREGNQLHMSAFYNPGRNGGIECTKRVPIVTPQIVTRYPFVLSLNQGAVENIFLDSMRDHGVEVERPKRPVDIDISKDVNELSSLSSYPVKVTVENLDAIGGEGKIEIVHAKFVVGADGAHSWVRTNLGIEMEGEQTDYVWGVVDMVPDTNLPDIRRHTKIQSEYGSCNIIPRERDLVRLYVQLSDADVEDLRSSGKIDKNKTTPQTLISAARKILHPFKLGEVKYIDWWTVYAIGQRMASSYSVEERVFIAGDACHTHSPQAGQGMNAGMNDTHNLAWKLVQVLRGWSSPALLKTYEHERRKFAQDLIKFDKEHAALLCEKPKTAENPNGVSHEQLLGAFWKFAGLKNGTDVHYPPCAIVDPKHQKYAEKLIIGQRMPPHIFVRAADIHPIEIQDLLPSDVRFKLLFFVGSLTETRVTELNLLAEELNKTSSFLHKYSPDGNASTVFDIITITAGKKDESDHSLVPEFFRPHWTKVLLDDTDATGSQGGYGYETLGIDSRLVTIVIVRPDGHVGTVAPSTAIADLDDYFGSFLLARNYNSC